MASKVLRIAVRVLLVVVVVVVAGALWLMRPLGAEYLKSEADPATTFQEADARIMEVMNAESELALQPEGRSVYLLHDSKVATAVVIFHGFTDVTDQFSKVAQGYYEAGYNVWIPRMPFHGYVDRMTSDPSRITPDLLRQTADENVDIAAGLGEHVEVIGLSGGGAMASWCAAERPDVDRTVIVSPLMLPKGYETWMVRPLARLVGALPDSYTWWTDKQNQEPGPEYPRYSRHGIVSYLMLVERVKADGRDGATPIAGSVVIVSNLADQHLDTQYPVDVVKPLVADARAFRAVTIPASEGLKHDIVGVTGENRPRIRVAYEYLEDALGIALPDPVGEGE